MIPVNRNSGTIYSLNPLPSSNMVKAVMGEEQITLVWEDRYFFQFQLGDYITYEGSRWTLNQLPTVKKLSTKLFQYNAVFQSTKYELSKAMYLLFDNTSVPPQGEFPLTGTAETFLQLLVDNLNRVEAPPLGVGGSWSVGDIVENTPYKNLTFSNEDCLSVLTRLANEYETEYRVDNHVISLKKVSTTRQITLEYGSTLYDIERSQVSNGDVITRLYPFGSSKNLAANYRSGSNKLLIPAPNQYIEKNVSLYGVIEATKTFDDIYPRLAANPAGTVTAVGGNEFTFVDSQIDFDVNSCLLDGTPAKVHFNTGQCAGYDFEIKSYNHATKTFVIIANTQEKDFTLPTATLKPAIGDVYVLLDIIMPPAYITAAENELLAKAQEYLNENSVPKVNYKAAFSSIYAKQNLQNVECGDTVGVVDTDLGIDEQIRIVKVQKGLADYWNVQFDLSNTVTATRLERIEGNVSKIENTVIIANDRINKNNLQAYQNTKELQTMVFDPEGYFNPENIKPLSIETNMLSVGAKSQSFQLTCILQPNYNGNAQILQWSAGLLDHFTLVDDQIKEWVLSAGSVTLTGSNTTAAQYIYARCNRSDNTADIYLSTQAKKFDSDALYWFFLIGILHSPSPSGEGAGGEAVRGISLSYGMTTINGQFIKTGVISSIDGATYFNLNTGEIGGNIKFKSGSTYKEVGSAISDAQTAAQDYADQQAAAAQQAAINEATNLASALTDSVAEVQRQLDGVIIAWYSTINPTMSSYPVIDSSNPDNSWYVAGNPTETEKRYNQHANDTYTNTSTGACWRFVWDVTNGWNWAVIADTATQQALVAAANAQTTANQKKQVFVEQPLTSQAYAVGDLWTGATVGSWTNELLKCITAKSAGQAFNVAHWALATKYTDDSAVNNLVIGGRNLYKKTDLLQDIYSKGAIIERMSDYEWALVGKRDDSDVVLRISNVVTDNGWWSFSFDVRGSQGGAFPIAVDICGSEAITAYMTTDNKYNRVNFSSNIQNYTPELYNFVDIKLPAWVYYFIRNIKIEKGNKATDWSPAPEDVQAQFDDISSDNRFTPSEKQTALKEWQAIQSEYTHLSTQVSSLGISNTLSTPYTDLANYINPLLTDLTTTSDIVGTTFRTTFSAYYDASNVIKNAISTVINSTATNGVTIANDVKSKVIGRNLIQNSLFNIDFNDYGGRSRTVSLIQGKTYCFSANGNNANAQNGKVMWVILYSNDWTFQQNLTFNSATTTTKSSTFTAPFTGTFYVDFYYADASSPRTGSVRLNWCKLEAGSYPTEWTEAPEDTQAKIAALDYLKAAMTGSTEIAGGLTATNVLLMKTLAGIITGGMSGLANDNIGFWAGGTYAQAIASLAKIILRKDGSGQLAGGKIFWDSLGALLVGAFNIINGNIIGRDVDGSERIRMSIENVPALSTFTSVWADAIDNLNVEGSVLSQSGYYPSPEYLSVESYFTIPYATNIKMANTGAPSIVVTAENGTANTVVNSISLSLKIYNSSNALLWSGNPVGAVITIGSAGTYRAVLELHYDLYSYDGALTTLWATTGNNHGLQYQESVQKTAIGLDGLYSYFSPSEFFYFKSGVGGSARGKWDIPAGLGGASINGSGGVFANWGKITGTSQVAKSGNNYTITHNIGDTNYSLILTPISGNVPYISSAKSANSVVVTCAGGFDFILVRTQ